MKTIAINSELIARYAQLHDQAKAQGFITARDLPIQLSPQLNEILGKLEVAGTPGLVVGGAVRDALLGVHPKDLDVEVYNTTLDQLAQLLSSYGHVDLVGKQFGVLKLRTPDEQDFDFSVPRRDNKVGLGHKDFQVSFDPTITPSEAAARRDFTINAMAYNPITHELHDYWNGEEDLKNKVLRATSPAFMEDSLRALRALQFVARFGFHIEPETAKMCQQMADETQVWIKKTPTELKELKRLFDTWTPIFHVGKNEIKSSRLYDGPIGPIPKDRYLTPPEALQWILPVERVWTEFEKLLMKGVDFHAMFDYLKQTGWDQFFPEISNLVGIPQEYAWHPEGWKIYKATRESKKIYGTAVTFKLNLQSFNILLENHGDKLFVSTMIRSVGEYVLQHMRKTEARVPNTVIIHHQEYSRNGADMEFVFHLELHDGNLSSKDLINVEIGHVATHTAYVMQAAREISDQENLDSDRKLLLMTGALLHDVAKPKTTVLMMKAEKLRWTSHGHESAGGPMAEGFLKRLGAPRPLISQVVPLVANHLAHTRYNPAQHGTPSVAMTRELAHELAPGTIEDLYRLMKADHSGRPPLEKGVAPTAQIMLDIARQQGVSNGNPQRIIEGGDVMPYYNNIGSPAIGEAVKDAYAAYLSGKYHDKPGGLKWLDSYMQPKVQHVKGEDVMPYFDGKGGPQVGQVMRDAWGAQQARDFTNRDDGLDWLKWRMENHALSDY